MRKRKSPLHGHGFSLIELMITVAILAIIATIAYPSYMRQVIESHRSTGQSKLLEIMQAQERYFTTHDTYAADLKTLGYGSTDAVPADGGWYTVKATACSGDIKDIKECVLLTATPQNSQESDICGELTLNSLGQKGIGEKGSVEECW